MQWTGLNELREKYLSFFESKGHLRLKSFSLIPKDDESLLLINSGMAPMKKYFTGEVTPPKKRVTTCQKCIRTPDIERVGITARHGTYFEMLGNFSFGDYFKREATKWAWEFCTKVINLPIDRLWVSIYEDDDEAFKIWTDEVGVSKDKIVRLGKEDNFWEHGKGPCGPCSEIYFDRGEKYGCGSKDCKVGCDCDRFIEFWNLVFTQFDSDGEGNYTPLKNPNIDTGMGLERLACIMQDVDNLFLVDTIKSIVDCVCKIANIKYGEDENKDISVRVITDHIRSTVFMISDGVMPSNESRGYVLRRLLRRAARHGRLLGIKRPFLAEVCDVVIQQNKSSYEELWEKKEFIKKVILVEEENFYKTIDQGLLLLNDIISNIKSKVISGKDAFKLNDTFGFPIDLTKEIAKEHNLTVDEEAFNNLMLEQKKRSRQARKDSENEAWVCDNINFKNIAKTKFVGYTKYEENVKVLKIIKDNEFKSKAKKDDKITIITDISPFYAESGGQIGDSGTFKNEKVTIDILDTKKTPEGIYLHSAVIKNGILLCGDIVNAQVNKEKRFNIMRNHTGAHLLQAALRKVLGTHVEQAGQLVNDKHLRFDFTHFSPLTKEQIHEIETIINNKILESIELNIFETPIAQAKKLGAMALFGEKYGDIVRVVKIDDFSIELCGGTHIDNTSKLGLLKIVSEGSVASGVRRIEAITGLSVLNLVNEATLKLNECAKTLKIGNSAELLDKCKTLSSELKEKDKKIVALNEKIAAMNVQKLIETAKDFNGIKIITANFFSETSCNNNYLKSMCDNIKNKEPNSVAVLIGKNNNKILIAVCVGSEAIKKGLHAGKIVKKVAELAGGKGGGKPDMAMAGAKDINKACAALNNVENIVLDLIKF